MRLLLQNQWNESKHTSKIQSPLVMSTHDGNTMEEKLENELRQSGIDPANVIPLGSCHIAGKTLVLDPARFGHMRENLLWTVNMVAISPGSVLFHCERDSDGQASVIDVESVVGHLLEN